MRVVRIETLIEVDVDCEITPQVSLIHPWITKYLKPRPAFGYETRV